MVKVASTIDAVEKMDAARNCQRRKLKLLGANIARIRSADLQAYRNIAGTLEFFGISQLLRTNGK